MFATGVRSSGPDPEASNCPKGAGGSRKGERGIIGFHVTDLSPSGNSVTITGGVADLGETSDPTPFATRFVLVENTNHDIPPIVETVETPDSDDGGTVFEPASTSFFKINASVKK